MHDTVTDKGLTAENAFDKLKNMDLVSLAEWNDFANYTPAQAATTEQVADYDNSSSYDYRYKTAEVPARDAQETPNYKIINDFIAAEKIKVNNVLLNNFNVDDQVAAFGDLFKQNSALRVYAFEQLYSNSQLFTKLLEAYGEDLTAQQRGALYMRAAIDNNIYKMNAIEKAGRIQLDMSKIIANPAVNVDTIQHLIDKGEKVSLEMLAEMTEARSSDDRMQITEMVAKAVAIDAVFENLAANIMTNAKRYELNTKDMTQEGLVKIVKEVLSKSDVEAMLKGKDSPRPLALWEEIVTGLIAWWNDKTHEQVKGEWLADELTKAFTEIVPAYITEESKGIRKDRNAKIEEHLPLEDQIHDPTSGRSTIVQGDHDALDAYSKAAAAVDAKVKSGELPQTFVEKVSGKLTAKEPTVPNPQEKGAMVFSPHKNEPLTYKEKIDAERDGTGKGGDGHGR